MIPVRESGAGIGFEIRVHPRGKKNAIVGEIGNALKLSLIAPAVDGKANAACIEFFANLLNLPRSSVTIVSGHRSRTKVIRVQGLAADDFRARIGKVETSSHC